MINSNDINQKAVPVENEVTNNKISQKLTYRKNFRGSFIKKLKAISEQQIIGNP